MRSTTQRRNEVNYETDVWIYSVLDSSRNDNHAFFKQLVSCNLHHPDLSGAWLSSILRIAKKGVPI